MDLKIDKASDELHLKARKLTTKFDNKRLRNNNGRDRKSKK